MNVGSLFTGCYGLDLGLECAGWNTIWACENDKSCRAVLADQRPGLPVIPDVREVGAGCERPLLLAGGFPCQDLSNAGRGAGLAGERSGLWHEQARCIREIRPPHVLIENVPGIFAKMGSRPGESAFGSVIADLAEAGYVGEWFRVRAADVGAPHLRERVFIVARDAASDPEHVGLAGLDGRNDEAGRPEPSGDGGTASDSGRVARPPTGERDRRPGAGGESSERRGSGETQRRAPGRSRGGSEAPADPRSSGREGRTHDDSPAGDGEGTLLGGRGVDWGIYEPAVRRWERVFGRAAPGPVDDRGRLEPVFVEWMLGYPHDWSAAAGSRTHRLRILGNSVQVQVGKLVGEHVAELVRPTGSARLACY